MENAIYSVVKSIQIKIDKSEKGGQFVIEIAKNYRASGLENSVLTQGENNAVISNSSITTVINNFEISIKVDRLDEEAMTKIERLVEKVARQRSNLNFVIGSLETEETSAKGQERIENIGKDVDSLSESIKDIISGITDYDALQQALETDEPSKEN
jgi:hypothetical protein